MCVCGALSLANEEEHKKFPTTVNFCQTAPEAAHETAVTMDSFRPFLFLPAVKLSLVGKPHSIGRLSGKYKSTLVLENA